MADADFEASPLASPRAVDPSAGERERDLGFGAVVGRESRRRLLNADGTFNVVRTGLGFLESIAPYQELLSASWTKFLGAVALTYFVINVMFAGAYLACGGGALIGATGSMPGGRFIQAFFFSVQTFATIGYGQIVPNSIASNAVVTVEALVGLMFQALATGLLFARFSRPTASILFSRAAIIAPYNDGMSLQFRIANRRKNQIIQLEAQVLWSELATDGRGAPTRTYTALSLERNKVTFFPLSWTIVHPITPDSPIAGRTDAELRRAEVEILVLLSGVDDTFAQSVHTRSSYRADEIVWGARFTSMFVRRADGTPIGVDIGKLHSLDKV